ncbi:MerR family transcriptional regulator [Christensenella hongkongensis]|uniref:MerR family transcriptional regulator n=1 Tax=Christensenella hongkongensis TaxID=270498 RepID=UPI002671847A|nr:MerR family transcriptional regulator [Christensenella hongkongensis]
MYSIGMFSRINQVTPKTLRHYARMGLLKPAYVDTETGYRYYDATQIVRMRQILNFKQMGFSLSEILEIIDQKPGGGAQRELLASKQREIEGRIGEEKQKLERIESFLRCGKGESMENDQVIVKSLPGVVVASLRRVIPNYDALFELMPNVLGAEMQRLGCECAMPEYCFNIYHDGEYRETDIDAEMCEAVVEAKENTDIVTFKKIPEVPMAVCVMHRGGYDTLREGYAFGAEWIEKNGYVMCDSPRESYIDGIWNKDTEDEWLTEIQFPVVKAE